MIRFLLLLLFLGTTLAASTQENAYPYPVRYLTVTIDSAPAQMAYMDVAPARANGRTVLLLHGKNFNGVYWKDPAQFLSEQGFRVIVPDQVGWGLSDKPNTHYSFHRLAGYTKQLLDTLGVSKVVLLGHSMGGMLATRFALLFPATVERLVYENPIGLEDYRTFVPWQPVETQFAGELKADYASLKKYQQGYYPEWKPEYEPYVAAQWAALQYPDFRSATWASALAYEMIYEQPVLYEFKNLRVPTLLIFGQEDRTVVGKGLLPKEVAARHGQYPQLGRWLKGQIPGAQLVELKGVGHIPHVQAPALFRRALLAFLKR